MTNHSFQSMQIYDKETIPFELIRITPILSNTQSSSNPWDYNVLSSWIETRIEWEEGVNNKQGNMRATRRPQFEWISRLYLELIAILSLSICQKTRTVDGLVQGTEGREKQLCTRFFYLSSLETPASRKPSQHLKEWMRIKLCNQSQTCFRPEGIWEIKCEKSSSSLDCNLFSCNCIDTFAASLSWVFILYLAISQWL